MSLTKTTMIKKKNVISNQICIGSEISVSLCQKAGGEQSRNTSREEDACLIASGRQQSKSLPRSWGYGALQAGFHSQSTGRTEGQPPLAERERGAAAALGVAALTGASCTRTDLSVFSPFLWLFLYFWP